jgi:hypothetical protein
MSTKASTNKAARLAFLVILNQSDPIMYGDSKYLSQILGVTMRSIQRDIKILPTIQAQLAIMLDQYRQKQVPKAKTYNVNEVAYLLHLHPRHIRLLMDKLNVGTKVGPNWQFTETDIETLRNRPGARHRVK